MKEAGAAAGHCEALAVAWGRGRDDVLGRVKGEVFGAPLYLDSTDWKVHVQVKGSPAVEEVKPKAVIRLNLKDATAKRGDPKAGGEGVNLEFDRKQLTKLFVQLEDIQHALDDLM